MTTVIRRTCALSFCAATALSLLATVTPGQAAVIVGYDFNTNVSPAPKADHVQAGDFEFAFDDSGRSSTAGNVYARNLDPNGDAESAIAGNDYFAFQVNPDPGYEIVLESVSFNYGNQRHLGLELESWLFVRTSADGFVDNVGPVYYRKTSTNDSTTPESTGPIDLSGFEPISSDAPFEVRVYVYHKHGGGSELASITRLDNVSLQGDVVLVPEPSSMMLLGLGGLALLRRRRVCHG